MVGKGGAALAPINATCPGGVPETRRAGRRDEEAEIKAGTFRVDINEGTPPGSTIPDA